MSKRSARERTKRSRLAEIVSEQDLLRGSLTIRKKMCGKANCRCATGAGHSAMYLSYSQAGKVKQLYIPGEYQEMVSQWVAQYKDARSLLEGISGFSLEKLPGVKKQTWRGKRNDSK